MRANYKDVMVWIMGSLLLLVPAFYNGYPIVYSDTSTYLASGFLVETPIDRPITYGLFLRLTSLNGWSLWTVIISQAILSAWIIHQFVVFIVPEIKRAYILFIYLVLATLTSLPWTVCQLMPDVFTPVMMLSACLLLFASLNNPTKILLYFLFLLSTAMHMSHIPINVIFFFLLIIVRWMFGRKLNLRSVRIGVIGTLVLLTGLSILTMGSALSKSRHAFFMGAMVEHGIAAAYLEKHCEKKQFQFCNYKDSLQMRAYEFLWNESSPFYKMGGFRGTKREFNEIISGTFTEPEFVVMHISESAKATIQQCGLFGIGDGNGPFVQGTELAERINKFVPTEYGNYLASLQSKAQFDFTKGWNTLIYMAMILAVFILVVLVIIYTRRKLLFPVVVYFLSLYLLLNMWSSGTFANAIDRLGSKVIWILPLLTILLWINRTYPQPPKAAQKSRG